MPIMAANVHSDARGAAWLLASAARRCLEEPATAPDWQDALNNTYRLLVAFRQRSLLGSRRALPHLNKDLDVWGMMSASERHLSELNSAIDGSLSATFGAEPKEGAVDRITAVLRAIAAPAEHQASPSEKAQVAAFFDELLKRLTTT